MDGNGKNWQNRQQDKEPPAKQKVKEGNHDNRG
jgi:hypothetical protein